jgi:hypothetical protein
VAALVSTVLGTPAAAQWPVTGTSAQQVASAFDRNTPDSLKCSVEQWRTILDFAFRFESGYIARCHLRIFQGKKSALAIFARVTPAGKPPMILRERVEVPESDPKVIGGRDPSKLEGVLAVSGAFGVGVGDYLVEILAIDDQNRTSRRRWKLHVAADRSQRNVPFAIEPLTVEPLVRPTSDLAATPAKGKIRLTVLLNAVPINAHQSQLRAWDRVFLFESLYSLLRRMPYKTVRLVAFNVEQQREIFRRDGFDGVAFTSFAEALRSMETTTISVQALKRRNSPKFLVDLVSQELAAAESPDVVIFLGPSSRAWGGIGDDLLPATNAGRPPLFYFEYSPSPARPFPDAIERLTKALDGKTYLIQSPQELEQAIKKMLIQLKQE